MKLIIKGIRGGSCVVDAEDDTTILEIKQKAAPDLNIPVEQQTMVHLGKTLHDDKTIGSFKITDGTKLYVAQKKAPSLGAVLLKFLRQYYSEEQCQVIVNEFMKDFQVKVNSLSLDDLERIAKADTEGGA